MKDWFIRMFITKDWATVANAIVFAFVAGFVAAAILAGIGGCK